MPRTPVDSALDRLYSAPLDAFVGLRREIANELRAAGDAETARRVAAAPKPTRTAWVLDQIARKQPEVVRRFLDVRDQTAAAQRDDPEKLRAAMRAYRERVSDVVHAARTTAEQAGFGLGAGQMRRLTETLQAAGAKDSETRAKLLAGRLVHDASVEDPFAALEGVTPRARRRAEAKMARRASARERELDRKRAEKERAIEKARDELAVLERAAREARTRARTAEARASSAQAEAARCRRVADDAESRLARAREALRSLSQ
jgi:hypothetical protein